MLALMDRPERSRHAQLQKIAGELGRVQPYVQRGACQVPGWYIEPAERLAAERGSIGMWWTEGGLVYLGISLPLAAATIIQLERMLDAA